MISLIEERDLRRERMERNEIWTGRMSSEKQAVNMRLRGREKIIINILENRVKLMSMVLCACVKLDV